ncbi:M24 family metallopeptidase [Paenibacillus rhizophilus]|uniref:M24 family metallopeptidase n=1 Tax=Paenibacillus rhizophilus TaxID=1850366 RepID=A0A3N9P2R6_9BACL|nr:M24 family metallopeptidase [Paenibacillus rhizophilus]RQW09374.1 M24 family metallopeptidase [Paenibacillus rhizophilus]
MIMPANETARRMAILKASLAANGIAALVVYGNGAGESGGTVRYLTSWMPQNSDAILIVPAEGMPVLITSDKNRARGFIRFFSEDGQVVKTNNLFGTAKEALASAVPRGKFIAQAGEFDLTAGRAKEFRALLSPYEVADGNTILNKQRLERTPFEAEKHRKATALADKLVAHAMGIAAIKGVTGADIMADVEYFGRRLGADLSVCWIAIGERPAETMFELFELTETLGPDSRFQIGATICLDGYFSQVLRIGTFKEPSARLKETAAAIIAMQDAALAKMVPGTPVHAISDVLESMIDEYCPYTRATDPFRFQACHAMSCSYVDPGIAPFLYADRDKSFDLESPLVMENQVYEVHPNFTLPDLGHVVAGDVAVVGSDGASWASKFPRGIFPIS